MSALKDILDKMYVEEELLAQLDEEQKQILFCKMREEQLRRWRQREAEEASSGERRSPTRRGKRRISWQKGADGNVLVWVLGEAADDQSIENIIAEEARQKARLLAETEMLLERLGEATADEEALKRQLGALRLGATSPTVTIDELPSSTRPSQTTTRPRTPTVAAISDATARLTVPYYAQTASRTENNDSTVDDRRVETSAVSPSAAVVKTAVERLRQTAPSNGATVGRSVSPSSALVTPATTASTGATAGAHLYKSYMSTPPGTAAQTTFTTLNGTPSTSVAIDTPNRLGPPPPIPARPPHLARKRVSTPAKPKTSPSTAAVSNTNAASEPMLNKQNPKQGEPPSHPHLNDDEIERRQSRIFEQLMSEHERLNEAAAREAEREDALFAEQEKKAREAEAQLRQIAQRAREQHRNLLRTSTALLPVLNNTSATTFRDAVKRIPRPPKPPSRDAIVRWFREVELPIGTGINSRTRSPYTWFHGILSRRDAESLIDGHPAGSFIVRLSERIWGYTVSYAVGDETSTSKHFLVEKLADGNGGYQFMGTNQIVHESLAALINYHETRPITAKGGECLTYAVGQAFAKADYDELFDDNAASEW